MVKFVFAAGAVCLGLALSSGSAEAATPKALEASSLAASGKHQVLLVRGGRPVGTIQTPGSGRPAGGSGGAAGGGGRNKGN